MAERTVLREVREHPNAADPRENTGAQIVEATFQRKTGTAMANSKIPLRKWAIAIYNCLTSLKSVSSMKLHRDLRVSQPTAWFMLHRIREAGPASLVVISRVRSR